MGNRQTTGSIFSGKKRTCWCGRSNCGQVETESVWGRMGWLQRRRRDDPKESRPLDCIEAFGEGQPLINCNVVVFLDAYLVVYGEKDMTMGIKIVDGPSIICIFFFI